MDKGWRIWLFLAKILVGIINSYPWILIQNFIFSTWITIRGRAYKGWRFASITILNSFVMRLFVVTYSQTSCKRLPEKSSLDFHILESLHIVTGPFCQRSAIPALEYFSLNFWSICWTESPFLLFLAYMSLRLTSVRKSRNIKNGLARDDW